MNSVKRDKNTHLGLWFFAAFSEIFSLGYPMSADVPCENKLKKEKNSRFLLRSVHVQIMLVVLAFTVLVCISLRFMDDIMNRQMTHSIEAVFNDTEINITADLKEIETQLDCISETIRLIILEDYYWRMRLILIFVGIALSALFSTVLLRLSSASNELKTTKEECGLTVREQEIFNLLLAGKEPKEIALSLKLSYSGVNFHIKNLFGKLRLQSRAELLVKYRNEYNSPLKSPKTSYL